MTSGDLLEIDANDAPAKSQPKVILAGTLGSDSLMALSPNGQWLATANSREVSVLQLEDWSRLAAYNMNRGVKSLTWAPDGSGIACAGDGGVYYLQIKGLPGTISPVPGTR